MHLEAYKKTSRYRVRTSHRPQPAGQVFASNDYLSLSQHPQVIAQAQQALQRWGAGSTGSPLLSGYSDEHQQLETELANWLDVEQILLFSSGFAANHGAISTLINSPSKIYCDRLCHASILDGILHAGVKFKRFQHNQFNAIQPSLGDWLIAEGTYSMDGDYVDSDKAQQLLTSTRAHLLLDDAHGLGVWGREGLASFDQLRDKTRLLTGTFGKAFGVGGAFIAGSCSDIDRLVQFCREYIYSTAFPPAQAAAIRQSLAIIRSDEGDVKRHQLAENIAYFKQLAQQRQMTMVASSSPIQAWVVGADERCLSYAKQLQQQGFWVSAIRPPTVPANTSRLRFSLQSDHTAADISALFNAIDQLQAPKC